MIPRTRFDIGWRDLLFGFRQLLWPGDRETAQRDVERFWSAEEDSLASLSLRSGFDVALGAYDFPRGSEVLMSCMNIGPMAEIVDTVDPDPAQRRSSKPTLVDVVVVSSHLALRDPAQGPDQEFEPVMQKLGVDGSRYAPVHLKFEQKLESLTAALAA